MASFSDDLGPVFCMVASMEFLHDPALRVPLFISAAYLCGLLANRLRLPPLVGFLFAGIILRSVGLESDETIRRLSDLGVTLLMFTIGLKLRFRSLLQPVIWAGASLHLLLVSGFFAGAVALLAALGLPPFAGLELGPSLLLGFALSFSSTVFAVKTLEQRGEGHAPHGILSVGLLIMQDVIAVLFLTISLGKLPSPWAFSLLLLIPMKPLLTRLMEYSGHGDLLIACGMFLGLFVGAFLFDALGLKADLGALMVGTLVASHPKAKELSNILLGFKELLLIAFFLNIGLSESLSVSAVVAALCVTLLLPVKVIGYFFMIVLFRKRARLSFLSSVVLSNFSEFGLIVAAVGVQMELIDASWMVVIALALTFTFVLASPLNRFAHELEQRFRPRLLRFESKKIVRPPSLKLADVDVLILGLGRIGIGAYDELSRKFDRIVGVDFDPKRVKQHNAEGRRAELGDPTDLGFWERVKGLPQVPAVVFAMPELESNRFVANLLQQMNYPGYVFAVAHYPEEVEKLAAAGATGVYVYREAGAGLGAHVHETIEREELPETLSQLPSPVPSSVRKN